MTIGISSNGRVETGFRILLGASAVFLIGQLCYAALFRIGFPYELEWLEGWTVDSVRRVLEGGSLFPEPSVDFVPYIYTPLYTYASAGLAKLLGVGFFAPRLLSVLCAAGCLILTYVLVRRETSSALCGLAATGLLAGTNSMSGWWFDIARVDTMFLFFMLAAFCILRSGSSVKLSAWAGLAMGLAYLSKQAALLPLASLTFYCLSELKGWNRIVLPAVSGAVIGGSALLFNALTDGWYLYYTVTVPKLHGFGQMDKLVGYWSDDLGWEIVIAALFGLLHLIHGLLRERSSGFVFFSTLTVSMIGVSWVSRLHGGGYLNVLQPAFAILAILFGLGLRDLLAAGRRLGRARVALYLVPALQLWLLMVDPTPQIPTAQDVANGDAFVEALRDVEGEVYTPMHGYIPTLAGKTTFAHDGYLLTILRTGDPVVNGPLIAQFRDAFARRRFAAVVIDHEDYRFMDLVREHYRPAGPLPPSFRPRIQPLGVPQQLWVSKGSRAVSRE